MINNSQQIDSQASKLYLLNILRKTILGGISGFILFLVVISATKLLSSFFNNIKFIIDDNDLILSCLGFILVGLIKFLECIREDKKEII